MKWPKGEIIYANQPYLDMHERRADEVVGRMLYEFLPAEVAQLASDSEKNFSDVGQTTQLMAELKLDNGRRSNFIVRKKLIALPSGEKVILGIIDDISTFIEQEQKLEERHRQLRRRQGQLKKLATLDPLTGISNRRAFYENAESVLQFAKVGKLGVGLLMFDLDNFKALNDTYGHAVGDQVLIEFTKVVSDCIRNNDIFARLGGEEFALLLPDVDKSEVNRIGERIRSSVERTSVALESRTHVSFTTSVGGTMWQNTESDLDASLKRADGALYNAKRSGRNLVKILQSTVVDEPSAA